MIKMVLIFALMLASYHDRSEQKANDPRSGNNLRSNMSETKKKPSIKDILGKERVISIAKSRQINVYHVKEFVTDASLQNKGEHRYFADYEVLSFNKVNKKKSKALKRALLNASNYMDLEFINKCTFTATIGLELITRKETVNILVSYPCRKVIFIKNGQEFYRDLKSVAPLNQIAQDLLKDLPKTE